MSTHTHHSTFVINRSYNHAPERVYAAFATPEGKAKWFSGPSGWKEAERTFDFRRGGQEHVRGVFPDGKSSDFRCTYYEIVPNERIVYVYDMHANDRWLSTSLATIELKKAGSGTQMVFTEQGVFYQADGATDAAEREQGSRFLLDAVERSLAGGELATTFTTSREIPAAVEQVFAAFSPQRLARWWGPAGFTNTFHVCEFKNNGRWSLTMHGPDGRDYPSENMFAEVEPLRKVVVQHDSNPKYRLTIDLVPSAKGTVVSWSQAFENSKVAKGIEHIVVPANEQNLERLSDEVLRKLN
jgi:uncharacterized protein YndB with AHSA1/START domain